MLSDNNQEDHNTKSSGEFPRKLSGFERDCLYYVLPANKKGYFNYRQKIQSLFVIGYGRFGNSNLILGERSAVPDLTDPLAPVFALGTIRFQEAEVYIVLHEEFENQVEFDISEVGGKEIPEQLTEIDKWTYSEWTPGQMSPGGFKVREIHLIPKQIVLAIAKDLKRIWIYDDKTGINHFIPVTNFYNEIMRIKGIRDAKIALNSTLLFERSEEFSDQEIGSAFLIYNKYWKKIELDYSMFINHSKTEMGNPFLKYFKRG